MNHCDHAACDCDEHTANAAHVFLDGVAEHGTRDLVVVVADRKVDTTYAAIPRDQAIAMCAKLELPFQIARTLCAPCVSGFWLVLFRTDGSFTIFQVSELNPRANPGASAFGAN